MDAVCKMVTRHDHVLSFEGVQQARRLEGDILRAITLRRDPVQVPEQQAVLEADFLRAGTVLCSPLTRAVQTATVALRPLLHKVGSSLSRPLQLRLLRDIRERRRRGGRDTTGTRRGSQVSEKVRRQLGTPGGSTAAREYDSIIACIDYSDVEDQWWDVRAESKDAMQARIEAFVEELRSTPAELAPIIVVGHSFFFREVFRRFGGQEPGARPFQTKVLSNCGVVAVTLTFPEGSDPCITSQQLIFSSVLVDSSKLSRLLRASAGPKFAALASLLVFAGYGVEAAGNLRSGKLLGAIGLGLLLAQALQRFLLSRFLWTATPLWAACTLLVWLIATGSKEHLCPR
jgi:broad specificity phosphatase PhoE